MELALSKASSLSLHSLMISSRADCSVDSFLSPGMMESSGSSWIRDCYFFDAGAGAQVVDFVLPRSQEALRPPIRICCGTMVNVDVGVSLVLEAHLEELLPLLQPPVVFRQHFS